MPAPSPRRPLPAALAGLPIVDALDALSAALAGPASAVLSAPPGSGKTTVVPIALLDEPWLDGRTIVMLEPRRLAARAAAARMADVLGESVGERVGHRVRFDTRVSKRTRVEVVTEGVLTRRLQRDPALEGVGLVVLDEFHERSLEADLALALVLDARRGLREDLRVLVMSATLDAGAVSRLLGGAPIVTCDGRLHPVQVEYLEREPDGPPALTTARAVERAVTEHDGDVLVFLPGGREIRTLAGRLDGRVDALVHPLYGDLPRDAQDRAIRPDARGRRRVVLATNIAETSLTIEGVTVVVDAGLERRPRFDPGTALTRLETVRVSRASAEQRAGRAGRLGPGVALRLWTRTTHASLRADTPPEIASADLASLVLEVARWGVTDPGDLDWLDPPSPGAWAQAVDLLGALGALGANGTVTAVGEAMSRVPAHPRLARMLLAAPPGPARERAAVLAAIVEEGDPLRGAGADIEGRLRVLEARRGARRSPGARSGAIERVVRAAASLARAAGDDTGACHEAFARDDAPAPGALLALAYPDRVAARQGDARNRYVLASGRAVVVAEADALAGTPWLVAAALDAGREQGFVHLAAPIEEHAIEAVLADQMVRHDAVDWDPREEAVRAERRTRLGALVLDAAPLAAPDAEALRTAMLTGVRRMGLGCLPWTDQVARWRARAGSLRHWRPDDGWPDLGDEALAASLEDWLGPYLDGVTRRAHLARLDLSRILAARLDWALARRLDEGAPERLAVPSGSSIRLDYTPGEPPVLAVKLQELFGLATTPSVCWGEVPVTLHLLSPARRPVQVTSDLASFWERGYPEVRSELKGRYPKHPWPEDPRTATPTARTARRR